MIRFSDVTEKSTIPEKIETKRSNLIMRGWHSWFLCAYWIIFVLLSSFFDTVFEACLVRISHFLSGSLTLQVAEFMEQDSLLLSQRLLELDNCLLSFIAVSVNIVKNCSGIIHNRPVLKRDFYKSIFQYEQNKKLLFF